MALADNPLDALREPGPLADRRVLVVTMYYAPEPSGSAPYTTDFAEHLARRGAQVDVVTTHAHYPQWRRDEGVTNRWVTETRAGVTVHRVPCFVPSDPTLVRRLAYESSFVASALPRLAGMRPDVVVGCSPAIFAAGVGAVTARATGAPLVQWVQDVVSAAASQSGVSATAGAAGALERLERAALRRAHAIAVPSEAIGSTVHRLTSHAMPVHVVRNWTRMDNHTPIDRDEVRHRHGWTGRTVVLHAGNIGQKQGLDELVPTMRALATSRADVLFAIAGDGNQRRALADAAQGLPNVQMHPPLDDEQYLQLLRAADVLLVHERSSVVDMSLPSKLTSYFAAGRPVLAVSREDSATSRELRRSGAGLVVAHRDPDGLSDAIREVTQTPLGHQLTARGYAYSNGQLDREAGLSSLEEILAAVWAESGDRQLSAPSRLARVGTDPAASGARTPGTATLGIPVFNEAERIADTLTGLADVLLADSAGLDWEILVVDDGSSDDTVSVVESLVGALPVPLRLATHGHNRGLGVALSTIFREAHGSVIVTLDADLSYDAGHIGPLVRAWQASEAAVVVASPYTEGGRAIAVPRDLEARSRAANRYLAAMAPIPVRTFTGMVRAYDASFVETLPQLRPGPSANVEILLAAWRQGQRVVEIPATLNWTGREVRRGRSTMIGRRALAESAQVLRDGVLFRLPRRRGVAPFVSQPRPEAVIDLTDHPQVWPRIADGVAGSGAETTLQ